MAYLIRATPDLPVTTAIKQIGISDPSDIRRLRDKHRNFRRIIPGKCAPALDKVYLNRVFERIKAALDPEAEIHFRDDGIAMFANRSAQTLHIPGRASPTWVSKVFIPQVTRFLRRARDGLIQIEMENGGPVEDIASSFGVTRVTVYKIAKRDAR